MASAYCIHTAYSITCLIYLSTVYKQYIDRTVLMSSGLCIIVITGVQGMYPSRSPRAPGLGGFVV